MALHLMKLSVGIHDIDHLAEVQALRRRRSEAAGDPITLSHRTRNTPRRAAELLEGGSIYWVIRGRIRVRQKLLGFEGEVDEEGRKYCRFVLDPTLVATEPWPHRAFQGWRYLDSKDAPPDWPRGKVDEDMPAEMIAELRELGLI